MPTQATLCPHCVQLGRDVRNCGNVLEAGSLHYLIAAVLAAKQEGASSLGLRNMVAFLFDVPELEPVIHDVLAAGDVEIANLIPPDAVRAQVLFGRGEKGC